MKRTAERDLTRQQQLARGPMDLPFFALTLLLLAIGLVMLLSASSYNASMEATSHYDALYYFKRQMVFAVLGVAVMYVISRMDYQWFRWMSAIILFVAILFLIAVLIPHVGITHNKATRWLKIGLEFQPSEIAKIGMVMYLANKYSKRPQKQLARLDLKRRNTKKHKLKANLDYFFQWSDLDELWKDIILLLVVFALLAKEPHLSAVILIGVASAAVLFAGGVKLFWFILGGGLGAVGVWFVLVVVGYNGSRIAAWLDPWADSGDTGYQIVQSILAIASGGLKGLGLGLGRQKYGYLPEEQNDYIFSIVCEELGFIGAAIIIVLFALLIIRGYWLAIHARDRFGALMIVGITTLLAVQVFLNIAVVSNLIPSTGISLPFFSYGGTALLIQCAEMGVILSVSRQIPAPPQGE